ncbi:hypothetical protein CMUS01_02477 [Colletotrichum musicola]|uniref:Uncharacterized protein n=1 Tax=Colletotrichum musicola TaxID=2175873 RepID=A0A8H6U7S9_9PEZI|nr:hypothetical protein CMUS01_02477 [Colletotrichum musicola]
MIGRTPTATDRPETGEARDTGVTDAVVSRLQHDRLSSDAVVGQTTRGESWAGYDKTTRRGRACPHLGDAFQIVVRLTVASPASCATSKATAGRAEPDYFPPSPCYTRSQPRLCSPPRPRSHDERWAVKMGRVRGIPRTPSHGEPGSTTPSRASPILRLMTAQMSWRVSHLGAE